MTLVELLSSLRARDINLWAEGDRLRYSAPSGALTPEIREELVKHKTDLLAFLSETDRARRLTSAPISRVSREGSLPASINQKRMWFIDQLQANTAFNCPNAFRITGSLNIAALEQSLNEIVRRHEILRTTFSEIDGEPVQVIAPALKLRIKPIDLRELADATSREAAAETILSKEAERPFDLAKGPLFRACLLCLGIDEHVLLLNIHHTVTDGWSTGILLKELTVLYESFFRETPSLPELPIQYADFAHWQSQSLQGEALQQELAHWKERLKGAPEVTELPTDYPRPAVQNFQGGSEPVSLSESLTRALKTLSKKEGATLFMTLLAAFKTLLYRYSGQEDLVLGSPIAGRMRGDIENLIGLFINTLVLRTDLSGNPTFRELLRRVRGVALEAYAHQEVPFEKLMEDLHLERSLSFTSLFQVMFVLQNTPDADLKLLGLTVSPVRIHREKTLFDLFLSMAEKNDRLQGTLSYRTDLFEPATISRLIGRFKVLLEGIVADPDRPIATLPLLMQGEKHQLLVEWNDTKKDYAQGKLLHQLFEEQVQRTPNEVAVVFGGQQLTYLDLNQRANQLAHHLRKHGVGPDLPVGICVERSMDVPVGLLGILKAGGAYVPLDPQYPKERLAFLIEDAQVSVLVTQKHLITALPEQATKLACLDLENEAIWTESAENLVSGATADNLAYVIYTSGSTGKPKGVMISHGGICNRLLWGQEAYQLTASDRVLHAFSLSFDFASWEIFTALISGATLIVAEAKSNQDSRYLVKLILGSKITVAGFVPSMLEAILDESEIDKCHSLKRVVCGGEVLPRKLEERFFARQDAELQNTYGPTEASIDVTYCICRKETNSQKTPQGVPIGRPIANTQIYILDSYLQPVPVGMPGELHIGGAGLARGYLNRFDLTADKFIPNPFTDEPGARLYKTGDRVRYQPDGNMEFLGRMDQQVKIRGFRIEPAEIETVMSQHPAVSETVVLTREDVPGDKQLVAYAVLKSGHPLDPAEARFFLKGKLPEYMVPSAFVFLNSFPRTPNGKIDHQALLAPRLTLPNAEDVFIPARDELELQLTQVWERLLRTRPIGLKDNFFDLGGHSLLAVRLLSQVEKVTGRRLSLATLFQAPTIEEQAKLVRNEGWSSPWSSLVAIQPGGSKPPLFCVHAHDGNVLFWRELSRRLGPAQPFYGLQAHGLDGKQDPDNRVEDMASRYIKEIQLLQPEGPYFLGGHCFGGLVAFEMAQQLHAQGQKVALLALMDSFAPGGRPTNGQPTSGRRGRPLSHRIKRAFDLVMLHINNLMLLGRREKLAYVELKASRLLYKIYMSVGASWVPAAQIRRKILKAGSEALRSYRPKVYPGAITLFRAAEMPPGLRAQPQESWVNLGGGGLETHIIPGYFAQTVYEPRVRVLGEKLTACLARAQAGALQGDPEIAQASARS